MDLDPINQFCPCRDECRVSVKNVHIETATLVPPKARWFYAAGDSVEVLSLMCRTHERQFAVVAYTNADSQPDMAIHELLPTGSDRRKG